VDYEPVRSHPARFAERLASFKLPPALHDRLQDLLDLQDREGKLSKRERREAAALTQLVDMLSLMRLRSELAARRDRS
jgi:hypothetical protein